MGKWAADPNSPLLNLFLPIVGVALIDSPNLSLYNSVVFPTDSRPITERTQFLKAKESSKYAHDVMKI